MNTELTKEAAMERILAALREISANAAARRDRHEAAIEAQRKMESEILGKALLAAFDGLDAEAGKVDGISDHAVGLVSIRPSSKIPGEALLFEPWEALGELDTMRLQDGPVFGLLYVTSTRIDGSLHLTKRVIDARETLDTFSLEHILQGIVDVLHRSKGRDAAVEKISKATKKLEAVLQLLH